ncbi:hypothetical protein [Pseudobacteriovorax antillogorgiicola]|uniref:Hpt domain-containing protein n=1 Tax=Pseudobacteriovorax antillogorgiicola TaxID=1513793 RepID=A0A1Y6B443_9BACT|nr:hypothetical protein [Pseudobacteriovorax antillogorgiicola]TCS59423.1 hypothetical protein EDD56_101333 [Pseudobacteriovorax antillogorgiicola]SME88407.1 hypothetical protein SAMN06296036_101152 [Pseudobacteriovorax antillogorgiicola]
MMKSTKVLSPQIAQGFSSKRSTSIDRNMLDMLKQISDPSSGLDFQSAIEEYSQKILHSLKNARQYLTTQNNQDLEQAALELSTHALRVGAAGMLKSAFELQSVARYKDFEQAEVIVQDLELEYLNVRRDLESVI